MRQISCLLFSVVLSASPNALSQENFGDAVVKCLAEKKAEPGKANFSALATQCEREIDRVRRTEKLDAYKEKWHVCLVREIIKLDDGVSPASDIATALQSSCGSEYAELLDAATLSPESRYQLYQDRFKATKESSIPLVLIVRAKKRAQ